MLLCQAGFGGKEAFEVAGLPDIFLCDRGLVSQPAARVDNRRAGKDKEKKKERKRLSQGFKGSGGWSPDLLPAWGLFADLVHWMRRKPTA